MNTENLNGILAQYIQYCKTRTAAEEGTVWRAADCFGVNWDIEDSDFPGMFADAMQQAQLALDNPALQPIGGVQTLMLRETEVELVRECFRWLFKEDDGDIAVIFFEQPTEALPHQLYFCLPQHQGLHAADGLQGRVVQRQLCLLHGVRKHTGEVAVLDIPVHAEAVGRTPDRSLFGGGAGLAILNVLCQNPIQIFRVQVNSSS